jgi:hypothetical protein
MEPGSTTHVITVQAHLDEGKQPVKDLLMTNYESADRIMAYVSMAITHAFYAGQEGADTPEIDIDPKTENATGLRIFDLEGRTIFELLMGDIKELMQAIAELADEQSD